VLFTVANVAATLPLPDPVTSPVSAVIPLLLDGEKALHAVPLVWHSTVCVLPPVVQSVALVPSITE
jgi:hypothetical protein